MNLKNSGDSTGFEPIVVTVVVVVKKTEKCKNDLITHSDYGRLGNKEKQIDR